MSTWSTREVYAKMSASSLSRSGSASVSLYLCRAGSPLSVRPIKACGGGGGGGGGHGKSESMGLEVSPCDCVCDCACVEMCA